MQYHLILLFNIIDCISIRYSVLLLVSSTHPSVRILLILNLECVRCGPTLSTTDKLPCLGQRKRKYFSGVKLGPFYAVFTMARLEDSLTPWAVCLNGCFRTFKEQRDWNNPNENRCWAFSIGLFQSFYSLNAQKQPLTQQLQCRNGVLGDRRPQHQLSFAGRLKF